MADVGAGDGDLEGDPWKIKYSCKTRTLKIRLGPWKSEMWFRNDHREPLRGLPSQLPCTESFRDLFSKFLGSLTVPSKKIKRKTYEADGRGPGGGSSEERSTALAPGSHGGGAGHGGFSGGPSPSNRGVVLLLILRYSLSLSLRLFRSGQGT